jgi:hypothetical protein
MVAGSSCVATQLGQCSYGWAVVWLVSWDCAVMVAGTIRVASLLGLCSDGGWLCSDGGWE